MRVFPGGRVEVVVPPGVGIPAIERFVSQHRDWAERRAREFALLVPEAGQRRPASVELAVLMGILVFLQAYVFPFTEMVVR